MSFEVDVGSFGETDANSNHTSDGATSLSMAISSLPSLLTSTSATPLQNQTTALLELISEVPNTTDFLTADYNDSSFSFNEPAFGKRSHTSPILWYAYAALALSGAIANAINISVLSLSLKKKRFYVYLIGAAVSDLLFCLANLLGTPFRFVNGGLPYAAAVMINIGNFYAIMTLTGTSTFITAVMSAERAYVMVNPLPSVGLGSAYKQAGLIVVGCFLAAAFCRVPFVFFTELLPVESSNSTLYVSRYSQFFFSSEGSALLMAMAVVFEYIPFIALLFLNIYMISSLRKYSDIRKTMTGQTHNIDPHTTILLLTSVTCFLLFESPNTVIYVINKHSSSRASATATAISNLLFFLNHCIHLVFFCMGSKEYRGQLKSIFCKAREGPVERSSRRTDSTDREKGEGKSCGSGALKAAGE